MRPFIPTIQDTVKEREEMLLTELLGETVKIRGMGYKTMRRAKVESFSYESHPGQHTYMPVFRYEKEDRQQSVRLIPRLDVMTPDGWATVWDDGTEDLYLMDGEGLSSSAKPTGRKYKAGML
jgi:hypothetical protein